MEKKEILVHFARCEGRRMGEVWVAVTERGLAVVEFNLEAGEFASLVQKRLEKSGPQICLVPGGEAAEEAARQIGEYLQGARREFEFPIDWSCMGPFQEQALRITFAIPYGQTLTYADVARQMGKPRAARAVGRAEATNPMPLVIPCHRVVGSDGKLHGYGGTGGIPTKAWLLEMERGNRGAGDRG